MKKIRIKKVVKEGKDYVVYCGFDSKFHFSSKRKAELFIGRLNRFLNIHANLLNIKYSHLFILYRSYYFIINESPQHTYSAKSSFEAIEKCLDLAITRSDWPNGNHFTLSHLQIIHNSLSAIVSKLLEIAYLRSDTPKVYELNSFKYELQLLEKSLNEFEFENTENNVLSNQMLKAV